MFLNICSWTPYIQTQIAEKIITNLRKFVASKYLWERWNFSFNVHFNNQNAELYTTLHRYCLFIRILHWIASARTKSLTTTLSSFFVTYLIM